MFVECERFLSKFRPKCKNLSTHTRVFWRFPLAVQCPPEFPGIPRNWFVGISYFCQFSYEFLAKLEYFSYLDRKCELFSKWVGLGVSRETWVFGALGVCRTCLSGSKYMLCATSHSCHPAHGQVSFGFRVGPGNHFTRTASWAVACGWAWVGWAGPVGSRSCS